MRKLIALLMLSAAPALLAAKTYEVRSAQHILTVDVEREGDNDVYAVRVSDAATGALLATERLSSPSGVPAQKEVDAGDRVLKIAVGETGGNLAATLLVRRDGAVVDSMNASFLVERRPGGGPRDPGFTPLRVGGDVKAPVVMQRVEPLFPEEARKARVAGIVILEAIIDREGNVKDAYVLKPLPFGLSEAAVDAVKQWKFRPGTLNGQPVDVVFNLTVNFRPRDEEMH